MASERDSEKSRRGIDWNDDDIAEELTGWLVSVLPIALRVFLLHHIEDDSDAYRNLTLNDGMASDDSAKIL